MTDGWPTAEAIETKRLTLEPLRREHAAEMVSVLEDAELHRFVGGQPATEAELRRRYERQIVGHSPQGQQGWLNWVVRQRLDAVAVGTVQATLTIEAGRLCAELAWVIGTAHQRNGYATEAAAGMVGWLNDLGAQVLTAHIHPDHRASIRVAEHLGLVPTPVVVDGETRWTSEP